MKQTRNLADNNLLGGLTVNVYRYFHNKKNPMFYHLLELSHQNNHNRWSNIGFEEEKTTTNRSSVD